MSFYFPVRRVTSYTILSTCWRWHWLWCWHWQCCGHHPAHHLGGVWAPPPTLHTHSTWAWWRKPWLPTLVEYHWAHSGTAVLCNHLTRCIVGISTVNSTSCMETTNEWLTPLRDSPCGTVAYACESYINLIPTVQSSHQCTWEWQGLGSRYRLLLFHLMYNLPSSSQLEQTLGHTWRISRHHPVCFGTAQWSHSEDQWASHSWLEGSDGSGELYRLVDVVLVPDTHAMGRESRLGWMVFKNIHSNRVLIAIVHIKWSVLECAKHSHPSHTLPTWGSSKFDLFQKLEVIIEHIPHAECLQDTVKWSALISVRYT